MSSVYAKIAGAFCNGTAPFASHHLDRLRAAEYLKAALEAGLCWDEAEEDIRTYLHSQGCTPANIDQQVEDAKRLMREWLN